MSVSYRMQLRAAIAWALPLDELRAADRAHRDRWGWYALTVVWLFQTFSRGATLAERFTDARGWLRGVSPAVRLAGTYQGFVKALRRRSEVLSLWLHTALQERLSHWLRDDDRIAGWRPLAVDGTRFDCPRSRSCQRQFRPASRAKAPPQLALVTLWHLVAHCWWDGRVAPAVTSERELLRAMLGGLPPHALLVGDAGFVGFELFEELTRRGVAFLLRVGANVELLTRLGLRVRETADTVYLWPREFRGRRPPVVLRRLVVGTRQRRVHLLTNVLDRRRLTKQQAADFYRRRWGVETAYRAVKQTLDRRRLRSRAADLAVLELTGIFLASWALALLAVVARSRTRLRWAWSPAAAAAALRGALGRAGRRGRSLRQALAQATLPPRRGRRKRKVRQDWPHKKHEPPCGEPKVRRAPRPLARKAQHLAAELL
jgi:Transposase DDE domain